MTGFPVEGSTDSLMTLVDWIAAGTKVSAERILRRRPFQTCSGVIVVEPGGLIGAVKATLLDILRRDGCGFVKINVDVQRSLYMGLHRQLQ